MVIKIEFCEIALSARERSWFAFWEAANCGFRYEGKARARVKGSKIIDWVNFKRNTSNCFIYYTDRFHGRCTGISLIFKATILLPIASTMALFSSSTFIISAAFNATYFVCCLHLSLMPFTPSVGDKKNCHQRACKVVDDWNATYWKFNETLILSQYSFIAYVQLK